MAIFSVSRVELKGVAACVPPFIDENRESALMPLDEMEKLIESIGVERKHIVDKNTCTSDLCCKAAEELIGRLDWKKEEIDCLVFVSQTPDYILPATSCLLQERLGLSKECYTLDVSLGCSGWVYGLSVISGLLANGEMKKGLLLVGDTTSKTTSPEDKSSWPLFGDAGTATALEYKEESKGFTFHMAADGSGWEAIVVPDGGYRNPYSEDTLRMEQHSEGVVMNRLHCRLDGMTVFSFAISKAPKSVKTLLEKLKMDREQIDFYLFHQANFFLNETIRKKLKLNEGQVPYSLKNFGNTSCATIPLTMVSELRSKLEAEKLKMIGCGFGVGLSWGSVYFETNEIICPELVIY